ncbi:tyrosine-type recombinase/integrase [Flagellimonas flava]|uniref:tyrosine-type recombinase/integrase n=1 Tax=Flagellimonas flava TaxID=570519 RepID=UPI003D65F8D2
MKADSKENFKKDSNGRNVQSEKKRPQDLPTNHSEKGKFFLTTSEIEALFKYLKKTRHPIRNHIMILMMYRHGFRVSELIDVRMTDLDMDSHRIYVRRIKKGLSTHQPMTGDEVRALKRYLRLRKKMGTSDYLFLNERKEPFSRKALNYIMETASVKLGFRITPHMLRHSCGYYLADNGTDLRTIQDYLGHRDPKHTVIYTQIAGSRFNNLWK